MRSRQINWSPEGGLKGQTEAGFSPGLVMFFGSRAALADGCAYAALKSVYPESLCVGCSTGGQFTRDTLSDDTVLAVAVAFDEASVCLASAEISETDGSRSCGRKLAEGLPNEGLRSVLVFSDGLHVNGSELVAGLQETLPPGVVLSGGLAGDGSLFETTLVAANCAPRSGLVAAIGFYGESLTIGTGSAGGWDSFGPRRRITRSEGNVLFELDGSPALALYERYLGEEDIAALPGSALLFPLKIENPSQPQSDVVRTILAIDRDKGSMTFAGDMPQGWSAQLMRGNFEHLIEGAALAAHQAAPADREAQGFSLLVSCIGRRLLLSQRASDEIDSAVAKLSRDHAMIGFYSYGEISPHAQSGYCQLHNQTMTVLSVSEKWSA